MIRRLAYRNMKRFAGDYQIYMITLVVVVALLYAFDSLFSVAMSWKMTR